MIGRLMRRVLIVLLLTLLPLAACIDTAPAQLPAVSWGMFLVGSALVGKKGIAYLKRRFFER